MDGGETWSEAELVTESAVRWSSLRSDGRRSLYRVWAEAGSGAVWFDRSSDGGNRWSRAEQLPALTSTSGDASVLIDRSGSLHLFAAVKQVNGNLVVQHWSWETSGWRWAGKRWLRDQH
jgi:hypothetical protein